MTNQSLYLTFKRNICLTKIEANAALINKYSTGISTLLGKKNVEQKTILGIQRLLKACIFRQAVHSFILISFVMLILGISI